MLEANHLAGSGKARQYVQVVRHITHAGGGDARDSPAPRPRPGRAPSSTPARSGRAGLFLGQGVTGVSGQPGRTVQVTVHGEVQLRLQSIGPGEYVSPPQLSSAAVRFVGASLTGPAVPAGVTQLFSFVGAAPGTAIVTFVHTGTSGTIVDTIHVQ